MSLASNLVPALELATKDKHFSEFKFTVFPSIFLPLVCTLEKASQVKWKLALKLEGFEEEVEELTTPVWW